MNKNIEQYNKAFFDLVNEFTKKIFDDYLDEYTMPTDVARITGTPNLSHLAPDTVDFMEGEYSFSISEIYETLQNDFSKESVKSWYNHCHELYCKNQKPEKNFYNYCKFYQKPDEEKADQEKRLKESKERLEKAQETFADSLGVSVEQLKKTVFVD